MTDRPDLLELAERCEAATGEQQAVVIKQAFLAAFGAIDRDKPLRRIAAEEGVEALKRQGRFERFIASEAYTDAALTLVPEGWERIQQEQARMSDGSIRCWATVDNWPASPKRCATPALAICAAALRARAAMEQANDR